MANNHSKLSVGMAAVIYCLAASAIAQDKAPKLPQLPPPPGSGEITENKTPENSLPLPPPPSRTVVPKPQAIPLPDFTAEVEPPSLDDIDDLIKNFEDTSRRELTPEMREEIKSEMEQEIIRINPEAASEMAIKNKVIVRPKPEGSFPEITLPEESGTPDPDMKLFESWLSEDDKKAKDSHPETQKKAENKNAQITTKPDIPKLPEFIAETPKLKPKPHKKKRKSSYTKYRVKLPFTYKSWRLPNTIYKKHYSKANEHLPVATYEEEYDSQMFAAAARDDVVVLRAFLKAGRDVEMATPVEGEPLLLYAVRYRALNAVRMLLGRGADPNRTATNGGTALHYAVANHDYAMAEALLAGGAKPDIADRKGVSPLQMAQRMHNENIIIAMRRAMDRRNKKL